MKDPPLEANYFCILGIMLVVLPLAAWLLASTPFLVLGFVFLPVPVGIVLLSVLVIYSIKIATIAAHVKLDAALDGEKAKLPRLRLRWFERLVAKMRREPPPTFKDQRGFEEETGVRSYVRQMLALEKVADDDGEEGETALRLKAIAAVVMCSLCCMASCVALFRGEAWLTVMRSALARLLRGLVVDFALSWGWPRSFSWPSLHPTGSVQLGLALGSVALEPALGLFALLYSRARAENMKHHRLPRSALSFTRVTLLGLSQRIDREVAPKGGDWQVKRPDIQRFGPTLEFAKRTRAKKLELSSCGLSGTWRPCRSRARITRATRRNRIGDFSHVPRSREISWNQKHFGPF